MSRISYLTVGWFIWAENASLVHRLSSSRLKSDGIHNIVYNNIHNSELDCRNHFYRNIVLAGGNTMYPGMCERLRREIIKLAPPTMKVNVIAPNNQKYSSWNGGAVLASFSGNQFYSECLSKQEYAEYGPML